MMCPMQRSLRATSYPSRPDMIDSTPTPGSFQARKTQRILAIDLGKFKSVACDYDPATGTHTFATIPTRPQDFHDLLAQRCPDRLIIEIGSSAGGRGRRLGDAPECRLCIASIIARLGPSHAQTPATRSCAEYKWYPTPVNDTCKLPIGHRAKQNLQT